MPSEKRKTWEEFQRKKAKLSKKGLHKGCHDHMRVQGNHLERHLNDLKSIKEKLSALRRSLQEK